MFQNFHPEVMEQIGLLFDVLEEVFKRGKVENVFRPTRRSGSLGEEVIDGSQEFTQSVISQQGHIEGGKTGGKTNEKNTGGGREQQQRTLDFNERYDFGKLIISTVFSCLCTSSDDLPPSQIRSAQSSPLASRVHCLPMLSFLHNNTD